MFVLVGWLFVGVVCGGVGGEWSGRRMGVGFFGLFFVVVVVVCEFFVLVVSGCCFL